MTNIDHAFSLACATCGGVDSPGKSERALLATAAFRVSNIDHAGTLAVLATRRFLTREAKTGAQLSTRTA